MRDMIGLAIAGVAGAALGAIFFGGLWLTVRALPVARHPAPLLLASAFGRSALALLGLYLISGASWQRLLAGLAGLTLARAIIVRRLRPVPPAS